MPTSTRRSSGAGTGSTISMPTTSTPTTPSLTTPIVIPTVSATTPVTTILSNGEEIKPLQSLDHTEVKRVFREIDCAKSNGRVVNRNGLLKEYVPILENYFSILELWNPADGDWQNLDDKSLCQRILQIFPSERTTLSTGDLYSLLSEVVSKLRYQNIEQFNLKDTHTYIKSFHDATTTLGDMSLITAEQITRVIKLAIDNLTLNRPSDKAKGTSEFIKRKLEISRPTTFVAYEQELMKTILYLRNSREEMQRCGFNVNNNNNDNNKRKLEQIQRSEQPDKNSRKHPSKAGDKRTCHACGRLGHVFDDCILRSYHPHVNKEKTIPWLDSDNGKKCKLVFDRDFLPTTIDLDKNPCRSQNL